MADNPKQHRMAKAWHTLTPQEALKEVDSTSEGLSAEEANRRLQEYGPNRLRPPAKRGPLRRLLAQFNNLLIFVLIGAAIVTLALQHWLDAGVIMGVVIINAIIGFIQEGKAERALEAIQGMLAPNAVVIRDGKKQTINAEEVVLGDMVFLQSGAKVSADLRLVQSKKLQIDEAVLTGESVAVEKNDKPVEESASLGDRLGMAYSGTLVTQGQGKGVVVATGDRTEIGRISEMVSEVEGIQTPLLRQIKSFSRSLTIFILAFAALTFATGFLILGYSASEMFMAAVGLAVAAIPEGLPAIITITLSIGVQKMAHRNAIIRRLPAVETLGSVTVICSDKTGTITRNEMTAKVIVTTEKEIEITGVGYEPIGDFLSHGREIEAEEDPDLLKILRTGLLCNDSSLNRKNQHWFVEGDPTEGALIVAAVKAGLDPSYENNSYTRTDVIPFESEHKFMATLNHDHEGNGFIFLKGAPERLFEMCEEQQNGEGREPFDGACWLRKLEEVALRGQRLLGIAYKPVSAEERELTFESVEHGMVFLGLFGIVDPPRKEVISAIAECKSAGIRSIVITGDYAPTAKAIAKELGIGLQSEPITGKDIETMSDEEFHRSVNKADVFARTSPEHKLRLVKALQSQPQVVAMTGDGVNDAPALKQADIGVAMGIKGTEAAKEASEMVLTDDNFATIVHAVEEGRGVYDNLKKSILFMLPTNGGQSLVIIAALFLPFDAASNNATFLMPITPVQILWVNMVTTVTLALALAFQPLEPGVMDRPPRKSYESILSGFLIWRIALVSVLMVIGATGHFAWSLQAGASLEVARTTAINTLVAAQIFYLINSRFIVHSSLRLKAFIGSRAVLIAIAVMVVLQSLFTYFGPMQTLFGTAGIDAVTWGRILIFGVVVFLLIELEKALFRYRRANNT